MGVNRTMASGEIKYIKDNMKKEEGNLKKLWSVWEDLPKIKDGIVVKSSGKSANKIKNCIIELFKVQQLVSLLLSNSVGFFNELGISFTKADDNCAEEFEKNEGKYMD